MSEMRFRLKKNAAIN